MTVVRVDKDVAALALTLVAHFDADLDRVWQLWADPRQLERWWGPPEFPATITEHNLTPGGAVAYVLTGVDASLSRGRWQITSVDPPTSLEFVDGFADQAGTRLPDDTIVAVRLARRPDGSTDMIIRSTFASRDQMDQMMRLGADQGLALAVGQIDALLTQ